MSEERDLRSMLAEATDASEAAEKPAEREKPEVAKEVAETEKDTSAERPRGPDGKFLPKEAAETEAPDVEDEPEPEPEPEAKEPVVEVPQHWSQADKDLVAKLPAEHRQAVVDRYKAIEAGFTPKLQRAAELEKQFGGAQELFAPYAEVLRQRNQTPSDIIKTWAAVEQGFVNGQGAQLVANLIRNYRVDPGQVAAILQGQAPAPQGQGNGQQPPAVPPEIVQEIVALKQWRAQNEQAVQQERLGAAQRQIEAFTTEKDAAGNLAHPFFSDVESDMMELARLTLAQGKPLDLADLYDRALYANRETREKLLASKEAEAKRQAAADRKARAAAAQRAASSVAGSSPGSGQGSNEQRDKPRSLREELETHMAEYDAA